MQNIKDLFPNFYDKDSFFESLSSEKQMGKRLFKIFILLIVSSMVYGMIMGSFNSWMQAVSSGIKVPALLILTIVICFPAFFTIQYILGSKMNFMQMAVVIFNGFLLTTAIMVSFAPIVLFFLITGSNYAFLKLLHVAIFAVSGLFGIKIIMDALVFSCEKKNVYPKTGIKIFRIWIFILAFVGMQLAWNLRPFLGDRKQPFELFRNRGGNFYQAVGRAMVDLVDGDEKNSRRKSK